MTWPASGSNMTFHLWHVAFETTFRVDGIKHHIARADDREDRHSDATERFVSEHGQPRQAWPEVLMNERDESHKCFDCR